MCIFIKLHMIAQSGLVTHLFYATCACVCLKKKMNATQPPEQSKDLGGHIGCKGKKLYMVLEGFPNVIT